MTGNSIVFAYDFPHKKSQDVILRLTALGHRPVAVIAAPRVALPHAGPAIRVKPRHADLVDPADLCERLGIEYHIADHSSDLCLDFLDLHDATVGIVGGARILPRAVIERFSVGIMNLHPGLIPEVRGLDALLWAIFRDVPLGVTAHLIDSRVDSGWILARQLVDEYPDDTLVDLSLRLYETQLAMLGPNLDRALATPRSALLHVTSGSYNPPFPAELVPQLLDRFDRRKRQLLRQSA